MKRDDQPLSGNESLLIIQQMIDTAKHEQKDDGKGWIIWGWMLFAASVLTIINIYFQWFNTFFFWNAFGLVAIGLGIFAASRAVFFRKGMKVRTYTYDIFEKLNVGFFICLMFIIVAINVGVNALRGFPLLMCLYGFWIFIYGALLNFKPSFYGAYAMWALAFIALLFPRFIDNPFDDFRHAFMWTMVLHGLGVLFGYIIPGHIANKEFKKVTARNLRKGTASV